MLHYIAVLIDHAAHVAEVVELVVLHGVALVSVGVHERPLSGWFRFNRGFVFIQANFLCNQLSLLIFPSSLLFFVLILRRL